MSSPAPAPTRECGDCTLCCKIMGIRELDKPPGVWCGHCRPARGCAIYDSRPQECRKFVCGYLHSPDLDERWKPSLCKFVLADDDGDTRIVVDPARPDAWKKEPYYTSFKGWAQAALKEGTKVLVAIANRVIVVLPDRDVDLGLMEDGDRIMTVLEETPFGYRYNTVKLQKGDSRCRLR